MRIILAIALYLGALLGPAGAQSPLTIVPTCPALTAIGDANYSILGTDCLVGTSATLTAARSWTLPPANSLPKGSTVAIVDLFQGVSGSNTLSVLRNGSDTINKGTSAAVISAAGGAVVLTTDGVSNWGVGSRLAAQSAPSNQWFNAYSPLTGFGSAQPACGNLSNAAASCSTDATNANNISSGALAIARGGTGGTTVAHSSIYGTDGATSPSTSATNFVGVNGPPQTVANITGAIMSAAGTITNLQVSQNAAPGGGASYTYTLFKNGAGQALTCQISAAATTCSDNVHSVSVAAGDVVNMQVVPASTPAAMHPLWGAQFNPS